MAGNLRAKMPKDSPLVICELVEARRDKFVAETKGLIKIANSPKEVSEQCDVIITMLPKGPHVHDAFTNPETGLLQARSRSGIAKLFLECSTIDVKTSLAVGEEVRKSGLGAFADAPVSGGPNGAYSGTLTFMVGCTPDIFSRVKTIVQTMSNEGNIFHCGPPGAGLATKQINNYLSAVCILGTSEAMNMGIRYGLDPKTLAEVINVSSGKCYNSLDQNPVKGVTPTAASAKDFEGGFSTELCKGVIDMAVNLGIQVGAKSVLSDVVQGTFDKACKDKRSSGKDCRSVYRLFAEDDGRALD